MSAPKYAKRRDGAEKSLVSHLRAVGASVYLLDQPYDAIVGIYGQTDLVEFKTPNTAYGKKLNENQRNFKAVWQGSAPIIMRNSDDVDAWFKVKRKAYYAEVSDD